MAMGLYTTYGLSLVLAIISGNLTGRGVGHGLPLRHVMDAVGLLNMY